MSTDTFAPEGAFKEATAIDAMYYHIEPGDGTRYEFVVTPYRDGKCLYCLSTSGGAKFTSSIYQIAEVQQYIDSHPKWDHRDIVTIGKMGGGILTPDAMVYHIMIESNCNPWTAVAALMAMNRYICSFHY